MRNRKFVKPLLVFVAMVLVCIISVFATIAYLTDDTEVVKNTFTVGNIVIELDEADVDADGNLLAADGTIYTDPTTQTLADRTTAGNDYHLVAKHTYVKDPTVTVKANSEPAYLRAIVKLSDVHDFATKRGYFDVDEESQQAPGIGLFFTDFQVDLNAAPQGGTGWVLKQIFPDEANGDYYFEYRYTVDGSYVVPSNAADQKLVLFTQFTVPENATNEELALLANEDNSFSIDIVAQAIQVDTFAGDVDAAFAAMSGGTDDITAPFAPVAEEGDDPVEGE